MHRIWKQWGLGFLAALVLTGMMSAWGGGGDADSVDMSFADRWVAEEKARLGLLEERGLFEVTRANEEAGSASAGGAGSSGGAGSGTGAGSSGAENAVLDKFCSANMEFYGTKKLEGYLSDIDKIFKDDSSTKSLLEYGLARYRKFKFEIESRYDCLISLEISEGGPEDVERLCEEKAEDGESADGAAIEGGVGTVTQTESGVELAQCKTIEEKYLRQAASVLQFQSVTTSKVKKASTFFEKYRQINAQLGAMNSKMTRLIINLANFESKIPCYQKKCT